MSSLVVMTHPLRRFVFTRGAGFARAATRAKLWAGAACLALAACGGGADAPPPPEPVPPVPPSAVAPTITQQPADLTVVAGQPASFSVAADGTAPLAYQWQRNGAAIAGATAPTYSIAATVPTDTGAVFSAVVSNVAGTATSNNATLTVTTAPPVLTLTQQPASVSVVAGSAASFSVAATCSSGTPAVQWQRNSGASGAFVDIAGATSVAFSLTPTVADNGAQFRATVSCSGASASNSDAAVLTVTAPAAGILAPLAVNGLREQADIDASRGIVREASGSYAFVSGNTVRRLAADLASITLVAGSSDPQQAAATTDGTGAAARFNTPAGIAVDGAGTLYVSEPNANTIRRVTAAGVVTTLAGAAGISGRADGSGSAARFNFPSGVAVGPDGDLYVADRGNHQIRRVTAAGVVSTYAGSGSFGYVDGFADTAQFNLPEGIAVAADGTVYVSDSGNSRIRRIARSAEGDAAGTVSTLAGHSTSLNTDNADGIGTAAGIPAPGYMSLAGNTLYVRDSVGLLRAIDTATAAVSTVTGTRPSPSDPLGLTPTFVDGPPGIARLDTFRGGVAAAGDGSLIVTDNSVGAVRRVAANGNVTTIAMAAAFESFYQAAGGTGVLAQQPLAGSTFAFAPIAGAPDGSLVISDDYRIRRIAADGSVSSLIGLPFRWNIDGTGSGALLNSGAALTVGANGDVFFFDAFNIRRVDASNTSSSVAGAAYPAVPSQSNPPAQSGALDGSGAAARFASVVALVPGANGELFAADQFNNAIRRIDAAGNVTTYGGALGQSGTADGPASTARFTQPVGLARTPDGSLWVLDGARGNAAATLRRIAPDGTVSTFAGLASRIASDPAGALYVITDSGDLATVDPATAAFTVLIPRGSALTFGATPALGGTGSMTAVGVKQLVLINDGQLVKATLP